MCKSLIRVFFSLVVCLISISLVPVGSAQTAEKPKPKTAPKTAKPAAAPHLTNADILRMAELGIAAPAILDAIWSIQSDFHLADSDLTQLTERKVHPLIIQEMLAARLRAGAPLSAAERDAHRRDLHFPRESGSNASEGQNKQTPKPEADQEAAAAGQQAQAQKAGSAQSGQAAETQSTSAQSRGAKQTQPPATPAYKVSVSPAELDFGSHAVGTSSEEKTITITNVTEAKDEKDVSVSFLPLEEKPKNFRITENNCTGSLAKGSNCTIKVKFSPFDMKGSSFTFPLLIKETDAVRKVQDAKIDGAAKLKPLEDATRELESAKREKRAAEKEWKDAETNTQKQKVSSSFLSALRDKFQNATEVVTAKEANFNNARAAAEPSLHIIRENQPVADAAAPKIRMTGSAEHWKYPFWRGIAGIDVTGASSKNTELHYIVEFNLTAPLDPTFGKPKHVDPLDSRFWLFFNPRITSLPNQTSAVSNLTFSPESFSQLIPTNPGSIAQGVDVTGGLEIALRKPRDGIPWWGSFPNSIARMGLSFVVGAGATTPFAADKTTVTTKHNDSLDAAFPDLAAAIKTKFPNGPPAGFNVALVTPERSRFFRRYYLGLRFKTYHFNPDIQETQSDCDLDQDGRSKHGCDIPYDVFPGIADLTVGQDEAITAGHLSRWVLRLDVIYPLSFLPGFHAFGSLNTAFQKNQTTLPIKAEDPSQPASDTNTVRFPVPLQNRDLFRVGVGVDLIQLLKHGKPGQPSGTEKKPAGNNSPADSGSAKPQKN
jgi:hypothetical protein